MATIKKNDGRRYNRKDERDLKSELMWWCAIPEVFQKYFRKMASGKWLINIPELYFTSDSFDTLKEAVIEFVTLNKTFENSTEVKKLSAIVEKYR